MYVIMPADAKAGLLTVQIVNPLGNAKAAVQKAE
jgi:hypothetical protein